MLSGFEQALLALLLIVLMMGMGAGLTVGDFKAVLRSPRGPLIGFLSQYGWMPLIAFALAKALQLPPGPRVRIGPDGLHAYFVHSYHLKAQEPDDLVAETDYGGPVTAIVGRNNYAGTQFHPEKSQRLGLAVLANFLKWKP